ncbi:50S ribosomal protein L9 [Buchnera aphidicola str. Bp (Baizongia pistaciae)]|uniref:Large ribosomal subunit protein bL9 n=1 Tax=Buchnera aphidicola subsp. Baizongia pistaciae (strain Bp) TaxID=224915 RepID=RL9_BUCBP|nr:50S ribosomal protein L9 [Buchnera aphidicola]Q89A42.1 RecName: Full=Large ribosomal subunit protein bL9; AltName: Full=50S ribosomal protein L9 [Buchnera aphidicola str. Bp (Baizongia pistaciae)]AAO27211.1 50S ribosomal protein L9 [Buchnera aphidicola str. Bp (Baizongia pistaciae)]
MQIILLEKLDNLGNKGDILFVKSGYARNFLIPYGKAIFATKDNIKFEINKKEELERELIKKISIAKTKCEKIKNIKSIVIPAQVGIEGKLFGSVGSRDIAKKLSELSNIKIKKHEIYFLNGALKHVGQHKVIFKPHHSVSITVEINIVSQDKDK